MNSSPIQPLLNIDDLLGFVGNPSIVKNMTKELLEFAQKIKLPTKITDKAYLERVLSAASVDESECKDPEAALAFIKLVVLGLWGPESLSSVERREFLDKLDECKGSFKDVIQGEVSRSGPLLTRAEHSIYKDALEFSKMVMAMPRSKIEIAYISIYKDAVEFSKMVMAMPRSKIESAYIRFRANTNIRFAKDLCPSEDSIAKSERVRSMVEEAIRLFNAEIGVHVEISDKTPSELFEMLQKAEALPQI